MADEQQIRAFGECYILGVPNGRVANAVVQLDGTGQMVDVQPLVPQDQQQETPSEDASTDEQVPQEDGAEPLTPTQPIQQNTGG